MSVCLSVCMCICMHVCMFFLVSEEKPKEAVGALGTEAEDCC